MREEDRKAGKEEGRDDDDEWGRKGGRIKRK